MVMVNSINTLCDEVFALSVDCANRRKSNNNTSPTRSVINTSKIISDGGKCSANIATLDQCRAQAESTGARVLSSKIVETGPAGCSITPRALGKGRVGYDVTFNSANSSTKACDNAAGKASSSGTQSLRSSLQAGTRCCLSWPTSPLKTQRRPVLELGRETAWRAVGGAIAAAAH